MHVLVFWVNSKTTSIIKESDLDPSKKEGEITLIKTEKNIRQKLSVNMVNINN